MEFCKDFNARTKDMKPGVPIPTVVQQMSDRSFTMQLSTPPVSYFLKEAAGIAKGAARPGRETAGTVTLKHVYEIAKVKVRASSVLRFGSTRGPGCAKRRADHDRFVAFGLVLLPSVSRGRATARRQMTPSLPIARWRACARVSSEPPEAWGSRSSARAPEPSSPAAPRTAASVLAALSEAPAQPQEYRPAKRKTGAGGCLRKCHAGTTH